MRAGQVGSTAQTGDQNKQQDWPAEIQGWGGGRYGGSARSGLLKAKLEEHQTVGSPGSFLAARVHGGVGTGTLVYTMGQRPLWGTWALPGSTGPEWSYNRGQLLA